MAVSYTISCTILAASVCFLCLCIRCAEEGWLACVNRSRTCFLHLPRGRTCAFSTLYMHSNSKLLPACFNPREAQCPQPSLPPHTCLLLLCAPLHRRYRQAKAARARGKARETHYYHHYPEGGEGRGRGCTRPSDDRGNFFKVGINIRELPISRVAEGRMMHMEHRHACLGAYTRGLQGRGAGGGPAEPLQPCASVQPAGSKAFTTWPHDRACGTTACEHSRSSMCAASQWEYRTPMCC